MVNPFTAENIMEQRSLAWHQARCGSLGSSDIYAATARTKTGWKATRKALALRMVVERLTNETQANYTSKPMLHGIEVEPAAREAYEARKGIEVKLVGLVPHPTIKNAHASPDGLVGDDGLVEFKGPNSTTHVEYINEHLIKPAYVPEMYMTQIQWQLGCTGRAWCDFVSYDPRLPKNLQLLIVRVFRDENRIKKLEALAREFLAEVEKRLAALMAYGAAANAQLAASPTGA
jgi:putative phage-type endonuclease